MSEHLQLELRTFQAKLPELLGTDEGKFVLIKGNEIFGTFESYADAMQAGYQKVGLDGSFLVKKISQVEESAFFSRMLNFQAA